MPFTAVNPMTGSGLPNSTLMLFNNTPAIHSFIAMVRTSASKDNRTASEAHVRHNVLVGLNMIIIHANDIAKHHFTEVDFEDFVTSVYSKLRLDLNDYDKSIFIINVNNLISDFSAMIYDHDLLDRGPVVARINEREIILSVRSHP